MSLSDILIKVVAIVVAISVHEFGHAYSAYLLGDNTAKSYGRMTLDPAKHLDPLGILMMMIFGIGWAKPVPVNPNNFKNYKIGNVIVSISGALGNILAAIVCVFIMKYAKIEALYVIAYMTMRYNLMFAAFNLLPIPPLDGWGIISSFIPYKYSEAVYKYESMSYPILLILIFTNLHSVIMTPIFNTMWNFVMIFY